MPQSAWEFFQKQILGMKWLNDLVGGVLTRIGIDTQTRVGGSLQFFLYDTVKILLLLSSLIFIISYIQSFFPPERTKKILGGFRGITANILGAVLGTLTPFCSCSSIPLFIGFTSAGLSLGVTFSFLISSPLVDLGSLVLLTSVFGLKTAVAYVLVGLILAVTGGTLIDSLHLEAEVEQFVKASRSLDVDEPEMSVKDRLQFSLEQVKEIAGRVYPYVLIGVGIGALIHNWIPTETIQTILGRRNPFAVVLATLVGVPMYADIFGTIPVAEALHAKGVGLGTILSFMMGVTALSVPSIIMLRKAVKPRLLGVFVGFVTIGIIVIGYVFNAFGFLVV